ncbi:hypothetical protein SPRG_00728 [Saprolegnia parasitica CBS 223.65]|uniref:Major facilitator superfamily (MFS) profile domain-containing protein n=1 Tax=Saprolegnia parasitica (strain CBS 223.65) TaxID=695850 RepID=A0A067CZK0_SAPPC|nr:hypothetical protein SPRG_00728 [Saprolegnia parasitica CBS 223.65]KDO34665.1 hypothetical protein SPRG_00728 [Saprolegnia parasitica CBS 223.65]|eukprot:XP_012194339.1 hypothetical protein SPRG_00728 [Saprolegnia parasitica CBS 223.65]
MMQQSSSSLDEDVEASKRKQASMAPEGCSVRFMFLLCAPRMAINMAWAAQWAAFAPLLESLLSSSMVQLVQVIGPITGFLIGPSTGVLSDSCTSRYGRRRPFIFCGAWATALCWLFLIFLDDISSALGDTQEHPSWKRALTILGYIWMDISVNLTQVPVNLLIADVAGDRQITAASISGVYAIMGSFVISGFVMAFGAAATHLQAFLFMLIVILLSTTMLVCFVISDKPFAPEIEVRTTRLQQIGAAFRAVYEGILRLPPLLRIYGIITVLVLYGFTAYNSVKGQFFGLELYHGVAKGSDNCGTNCTIEQTNFNMGVQLATGLTDTLFNSTGLVYLAFLPYLVRTFGAKNVLAAALLPQVLFIVMAFSHEVGVDVAIAVLSSITQNTLFPMTMPLIIHVVGYGEANQLGLFAGALNSAVCFGQFLNIVLASLLVMTEMGYRLPILVGGVLSLVAFVLTIAKFHVKLESM